MSRIGRRTILALASTTAFALRSQDINPVRFTISIPKSAKALRPGQVYKINLTAAIEPEWHLYSLVPVENGPIATRIWLPDRQPFTLSGDITTPEPRRIQDSNFGIEVGFYEGSPQFVLPVRVTSGERDGPQTLQVSVRFLACNDQMCLPPRTVKLETPVEIKSR